MQLWRRAPLGAFLPARAGGSARVCNFTGVAVADLKDDFVDDDSGGLAEGAGVVLTLLGAVLFWLGFCAGLAVSAFLS